jgi:hypothetical protein
MVDEIMVSIASLFLSYIDLHPQGHFYFHGEAEEIPR